MKLIIDEDDMQTNKKTVSKNILYALVLQFVTLLSGFIVPKIIMHYFGSEINGLVSSINQFLSYITMLEGGLSGVIMAGLYKPLQKGDIRRVSGVVNAAEHFFKKIALIYLAYVVIVAFLYPLKYHASYTYGYTFVLVWILAINLFTQYYFSLTYKLLIQADQKAYIVSIVQTIVVVLNIIATILIAHYYQNILIIKLFGVLFYFIQPVVFSKYVHSHYEIDKTVEDDKKAISQRWDGFWQNIAFFIHTNTDVVILTIFSSLKNVSVYTVYLLVINALKSLIISISGAIVPTLGNTLARNNDEEIKTEFDLYEFVIFFVTTFLFSAGISLIVPFVTIYTHEINDANYYQPTFASIMVLAEAVYCLRDPYVSISYAAGHFKQTRIFATLEAIINIVLSVFLVHKNGIVGVAIGTLVAMLIRAVLHIIYLKGNILYRAKYFAAKMMIISYFIIIGVCFFTNYIFNMNVESYFEWFILAFKVSSVTLVVMICVSFFAYKEYMYKMVRIIKNKVLKKE